MGADGGRPVGQLEMGRSLAAKRSAPEVRTWRPERGGRQVGVHHTQRSRGERTRRVAGLTRIGRRRMGMGAELARRRAGLTSGVARLTRGADDLPQRSGS